jgi:hypothetical protein
VADPYFSLSERDRRDALGVAADRSGRPADLLEKDVWVVCILDGLFSTPLGDHLTFKGGTSLSKAYNVIRRFSEDVDVTYDIRTLLASETEDSTDALPATRSQMQNWSKKVREQLPIWVTDTALPALQTRLAALGIDGDVSAENDYIYVRYDRVTDATTEYVKPEIKIEFGARSTGEPSEMKKVQCDAAAHIPEVTFPEASPRVMKAERTFWEKATSAHVYCLTERMPSERYARHWYDLIRLDDTGYAESALGDRALADSVARHKSFFFAAKDGRGNGVSYEKAISGELKLVPEGTPRAGLADDYDRMVRAGLLEDEAPTFDQLMERCHHLQDRANAIAGETG